MGYYYVKEQHECSGMNKKEYDAYLEDQEATEGTESRFLQRPHFCFILALAFTIGEHCQLIRLQEKGKLEHLEIDFHTKEKIQVNEFDPDVCCKSTHIPHVEDLYEKYIKSELWKKYLPSARRQGKPQPLHASHSLLAY